MKIKIKNRWNGNILFSGEFENIKKAMVEAVNSGSDLRYSDLRGSDLRGSDLSGSNLRYSDLRYSDLRDSNLRGSDLGGSDLRGSDLRDSDLRYSNLRDSNLSGSDLRYSDLRDVKNYSENHDIFFELIRRKMVDIFTSEQWGIIGQLAIHRLCWGSIHNRFGNKIVPIFEVLAKDGFGKYLDKYNKIIEERE